MNSELWQRISAARKYAGLSREELGQACGGVSRAAVGFWESKNPKIRTRPEHHTIEMISVATGAPLMWLLDDTVTVDDKWIKMRKVTPDPDNPLFPESLLAPSSKTTSDSLSALIEQLIDDKLKDIYEGMSFQAQISLIVNLSELLNDDALRKVVHHMQADTLQKMLGLSSK